MLITDHWPLITIRYPWRCLCFGLRLLMTKSLPLRRTMMSSGLRFFTDAETFTSHSPPESNKSRVESDREWTILLPVTCYSLPVTSRRSRAAPA